MKNFKAPRWLVLRFSLRALAVGLTLVCVACGIWVNGPLRQRAAVRHFQALNPPYKLAPVSSGDLGGGMGGALGGAGAPQGSHVMVIAWRAQGRDDHHLPQIDWWQRPAAAVLGEDAFGEVTGVMLLGLPATDDDLRHLSSLPAVERINLSGTKVTDAGLAHLRPCRRLTFLSLEDTAVTDKGLAELGIHQNLQGLSLSGTKITDAGLPSLARLPRLAQLWLQRTAITDAGYRKLTAVMPECEIDVGRVYGGGGLSPSRK